MSAEKDVEQSCTVWEQAPWSEFVLAEFTGYLPLILQIVLMYS